MSGGILVGGALSSIGAPAATEAASGVSSGAGSASGGAQAEVTGGEKAASSGRLVETAVVAAPRFREVGVAIGEAVNLQAAGTVTFPLTFTLRFDPLEPHAKDVAAELLQAFFFDARTGRWSTDGVTVKRIYVSEGLVDVETAHLTVFRLGVPRGQPPLIHEVRPHAASPGSDIVVLGREFSPLAAQNVLTLGGAVISISLDASRLPRPLRLQDSGETLILRDADGMELDRVVLPAAPAEPRRSWTRREEGDPASEFVLHPGALFSPGTRADGASFRYLQGAPARAPAPGALVINEALLAPPASFLGDANGDGETNPLEDEFIELVNVTDHPLMLGGCALLTMAGERHRVPDGTLLPGGMAMVVFGVDDVSHPPRPAGRFGGQRFFPDQSSRERLVARIPAVDAGPQEQVRPGTTFLTATAFRQTSNPVSLQLLTPLAAQAALRFADGAVQIPALAARQPRLLRAGDLDRDLDIDLVAVGQADELIVLLNDGFGRFTEPERPPPLPAGRNRVFDLAAVDVNEDGAPDLLIGDTDGSGSYTQLLMLENNGGGEFRLLATAGTLNRPASAGPVGMGTGDADGDGDPDVIVAMMGDQPLLFRNDGQGGLSHRPSADVLPQDQVFIPTAVRLADVDDDGDVDVLLVAGRAGLGGAPALQLLLNEGQGVFEDVTGRIAPPHRDGIDALAVGDVDGDGALDVVVGSPAGATQLFLNDGVGAFRRSAPASLEALRALGLALADFDGDGDQDLAAAAPAGEEVFLNDGAGRFSRLPEALPAGRGTLHEILAVDVDNDGDLDLLGAGPGSGVSLLLNLGTRINHPPRLAAIAAQAVTEGGLLEFTLSASDADGDPLTLHATLRSGEPVSALGASFVDHGDGRATFRWTPGPGHGAPGGRVHELLIRASDGLASDEAVVRITVRRPNHPPILNPVAPLTIDELVPLVLQLRAHDPDAGEVLTFSAAGLPRGATLSNATGLFEWTPDATQGDGPERQHTYAITFMVTDLDGETASRTADVTVIDRNHAPVFTPIPPQRVAEGRELALALDVHDPDQQDVVTVFAVELPPGAAFDSAARQFRWTPGFSHARPTPYLARFQASDGDLRATLEIAITVEPVNRPPRFVNLADQTVVEGGLLEFTVEASDLDGDPLTLAVIGALPDGAAFDPATGRFRWIPTFAQAGRYPLTFEVRDGLERVQQMIHVTVQDISHPPVLTPISDQTVREGDLLQVAIQVSDADGDVLMVRVEPLPAGAQVLQQGGLRLFQWVPGADQAGPYTLTVHASDHANPEVTDTFLVTVLDHPGFQPLVAQVGFVDDDAAPLATPLGAFGDAPLVTFGPGDSVGLDLGEIHPALVSALELFHTAPAVTLVEADVSLLVSDDNLAYHPYDGPLVFSASQNRVRLSSLHLPERFIKIHQRASGANGAALVNFLPQIARASGAIPLEEATQAFLDTQARQAFLYFAEHVNAHGLIPDRVQVANGRGVPGAVYSTAASGFWLAALPIGVERGWMPRQQAEAHARRSLEFFLGRRGGPVAGQFGFYYHFLNGDGTRFTGFGDDGVSMIDSTLLFLGALAAGEYFGGDIQALATELVERADWDRFYDHDRNMLRLVWTPEEGFIRHLDYHSEGTVAYLLAAGSLTHPIQPDPDLPGGGEAYYAFSRGNFGRVLGRFGREGRPLLQTFFGSLFAHLYPPLFLDLGGLRDAFHFSWAENTREAILANFRFAQAHPEFGYSRLVWGISASDGPEGYQGLYGTPPLDPGAFGELHDGTVAPYALAGSLPFAADLALPALQHLAALQNGRLLDRYGVRDGVNPLQDFFGVGYLGIDRGALLLGIEQYRTGLIGRLVRQHPIMTRGLAAVGLRPTDAYRLETGEPRSAHAYLRVDTTDHLTQTMHVDRPPSILLAGEFLLELHPFGIDTARGERFVDVDLSVNGRFVKRLRFLDRRGDGTVDVGSVYVPLSPALLGEATNTVTFTWAGGERWVQLEDVTLSGPTGRRGTQERWQLGDEDGSPREFGDERLVDDSCLVGDDPASCERALNVVDEPTTDLLFELSDLGVGRLLRLVAAQTQEGRPVTVEVSVNSAIVTSGVALRSGGEATVMIAPSFLREGWNHVVLRHARVPGDGEFIVWDTVALERQINAGSLQVIVRNVHDDQPSPELQFGFAPPEGAVLPGRQYLEIQFELAGPADRLTISTDNRNASVHRFTGPPDAAAGGLVGEADSTVTAPLLWQVHDARLPAPPAFTDMTEWAFVPDASEPNFGTPEAIAFRTLISGSMLGDRPSAGRSGTSPIIVYLVVDFRGKPAQAYGTDRLLIEQIAQ